MSLAENIVQPQSLSDSDQQKIKQTVQKIERLEEEKAQLAADIRDVYAEAKAFGYDTKALRKVIALRKMDRKDREEQEMMLDLYMHAVGEV